MSTDPLVHSKLTQTILKINPGVERQAEATELKLRKLIRKSVRSSELARKQFRNDFEARRLKRQRLYEKMRPKLDDLTRMKIEKTKEDRRKKEAERQKMKEAEAALRAGGTVVRKLVGKMAEKWEEPTALAGGEHAEWSSDTAADFSRRSSLKSSIFELGLSRVGSPGPTFTENPLMMMEPIVRRDSSDSKFPEVYVTKATKPEATPTPSPRAPEEKILSLLNLLPAPTPTRFVGKMHKKMIEERKKSETNLLNKSKPSSRRSSIAPSVETVQETKEVDSPGTTPRRPSISKAAKAMSKVGDMARKIKRQTSKPEESSSGNTSPSLLGGSNSSKKSPAKKKAAHSPGSSTSTSPLLRRERKGGKGSKAEQNKKEQLEQQMMDGEDELGQNRELKQRIFFKEKVELTDKEILKRIGAEEWNIDSSSQLQGFIKATTFAKKLAREKKKSRVETDTGLIYSGSVRQKLSEGRINTEKTKSIVEFLGKMVETRDKHGLYTDDLQADNPIFVALERLSLKQAEDSDSRSSMLSHRSTVLTSNVQGEQTTVKPPEELDNNEDVLSVLKSGLCKVSEVNISNWNTNNNDRTDVELQPIFIPF